MHTLQLSEPVPQVALIGFNRPASLNSMTPEFCRELLALFDEIASDDRIRVVVLTGNGRGFCSGHDLGDLAPSNGEPTSVPSLMEHQELYSAVISKVRAIPQPVVAAVNGPAAGGGLALALAADTRICSESARFNAAFVRLGLSGCDVGVSYLLPRIVGPTLAFEMMLTGRLVDAHEAMRAGLVLDVVADGEVVDAALDIAERILGNAPFGVRQTKRVMWTNLDAPSLEAAVELENRTQVMCIATADSAEAIEAFTSRRPPTFVGK